MMLILLQIVVLLAVASFLCRYKASLSKRNARSWESLLARLQPAWNARELIHICLREERERASLAEKWQRIRGARGLWAMYRNAGVMLEMADYAARSSDVINREVLALLRSDSMMIRVYVLRTIATYAFTAAGESICMNTLRVESAFAEMELRMAGLLEAATPDLLPGFVAAM
jgi:hypothetical protein